MASFTTLTHLLFPYLSILHKATYSNLIPTRSCQNDWFILGAEWITKRREFNMLPVYANKVSGSKLSGAGHEYEQP